jgi:hypothetical protein
VVPSAPNKLRRTKLPRSKNVFIATNYLSARHHVSFFEDYDVGSTATAHVSTTNQA